VRTQRSADLVSGCGLAGLGFVVLGAATQIQGGLGMEDRLPPRTLPYLVGGAVLVGGLALAWQAWRYRGPASAIAWPAWRGMRRNLVTFLALALYVGLLEWLGTLLATTLFITGLIRYLRGSGAVSAILIGVASGCVLHFVFIRYLELALPLGVLF
jgi:hypothetical protein